MYMYHIYPTYIIYIHTQVLGIPEGEKSKDTTINKNLWNLKVIRLIDIEN